MAGPLYFNRVCETTITTGNVLPYTLAGAVAGYQSWAVVGDGNTAYYSAVAVDTNGVPTGDWEVGLGLYGTAGTTLTRQTIIASSNSGLAVNWASGTKRVFVEVPAPNGITDAMLRQGAALTVIGNCTNALADVEDIAGVNVGEVLQVAAGPVLAFAGAPGAQDVNGFRLTLTSGTPVTTADVIGATTIYFTPYSSNVIGLYTGAAWAAITSAEVSKTLGTLGSSVLPYDVFVYSNNGALTIDTFVVWSTTTSRATDIVRQDGVWVKSGDATRRYVGTFMPTAATTTEDSGGGVTTNVGGKRFLFNVSNRIVRAAKVIDTTASWLYQTATIRQARAQTGNKVEFVLGLAEVEIDADLLAGVYLTDTTNVAAGIGLDSVTAFSGLRTSSVNVQVGAGSITSHLRGRYCNFPGIGYHYAAWLELGNSGTNCLFLSISDCGLVMRAVM